MKFFQRVVLTSFCFFGMSVFSYELEEVFPLYQDEEIQQLWDSFENILQPTWEDYRKLENYLQFGRRAYLDPLFNHEPVRRLALESHSISHLNRAEWCKSRLLQRMKFTGDGIGAKEPFLGTLFLGGASATDKSRCITLFASYNCDPLPPELRNSSIPEVEYSQKLFKIISELKSEGYKGHLIYRIGGYPLLDKGGIRLAHIPYSFKVLSFIEAAQLGYDQVLWIDCSVHPTNDLKRIFDHIASQGIFVLRNGVCLDYDNNFGLLPKETLASWGLNSDQLRHIPHVVATIIGVSFRSPVGLSFIDEWYRLTTEVRPAISLYPEEFLVSLSVWKKSLPIAGDIGHYMNVKSVVKTKPTHVGYTQKPFWFDKS